ncbi:MAG: phage portal protein [Roseburia sp.]|nr:phage portal protein [Roseburia sp.]
MNWIDNLVGFISPQKGYERELFRRAYEAERNYDAGNENRLNAGWRVANESAEQTDRGSRDVIRARARDLERNSDLMNSVIGAYGRNVIGGAFTLQAKTNDETLNTTIEELWKKWCKKRNCDVTGQQSLNQILRMAVRRKKIDGAMMIKKCFTTGGFIPFQLQCLEVDELDISQTIPKKKGNKVVGGIELNEFNRPEGYWIRQYSLDGFSIQLPKYVEAKDIIFYWGKTRPSQVREISDMTPTATRIRDTNEFMTAVSVKERIAACLAVFIKKVTPSTGGLGRDARNNAAKYKYDGKTLTPGMIKELNAGDEVQVVNPSGQATDATAYTKLQQRMIGAGQGISYEAMARDMSEANYSSARQGLIEDDLTYEGEKELLKEMMDEIYETFVISLVVSGKIAVKDFWEKKDSYLAHDWIQAPKKWIDPIKESNANKIALQTGQKTFQQIAAENGRDWKDQIDDMHRALEYGREKGIELGGVIYGKGKEELATKERE